MVGPARHVEHAPVRASGVLRYREPCTGEAMFVGASFPHATIGNGRSMRMAMLAFLRPGVDTLVYIRRHPATLQRLTVEADVEDAGTVTLVL